MFFLNIDVFKIDLKNIYFKKKLKGATTALVKNPDFE